MNRLVTATVALATIAANNAEARTEGPYVGAALAGAVSHHNAILATTAGPAMDNLGLANYSPGIDICVGYLMNFSGYVAGLEFDYLTAYSHTDFQQNNAVLDSWYIKLKSSGAFGVALRFGYQCNEKVLAYVRLGYEVRPFKVEANVFSVNPAVANANVIAGRNTKTAFTPGIGVDVYVAKSMTIGLEYREATFPYIAKNMSSANAATSLRIKPKISTLLLTFRYNFKL